jgi:hypothetical protein
MVHLHLPFSLVGGKQYGGKPQVSSPGWWEHWWRNLDGAE